MEGKYNFVYWGMRIKILNGLTVVNRQVFSRMKNDVRKPIPLTKLDIIR